MANKKTRRGSRGKKDQRAAGCESRRGRGGKSP